MKILFVSTRQAKPSFRFRVEQVLPAYVACGHSCEVEFLPSSLLARYRLYRRMRYFDAVFLQKRLLSRAELFAVRKNAQRLIYDLDDAVMFNAKGVAAGKRQSRFRMMVQSADLTICGNEYLAEQSHRFTNRCTIIPTPIDTDRYCRTAIQSKEPPCPVIVGWTGSRSTNRYFNDLFPLLAKFAGRIEVKILSDVRDGFDFERLGDVPVTFVLWSPDVEITETATFDIGVMPLPDDPWTRGK
ncbi:MAG: hypothetical protein IID45_08145, partial [Planctomycetes bacterium]|nr:hypothetical protein [Planctomycetota bacterium]